MHKDLIKICKEFETLKGFLKDRTPQKEQLLNRLFLEFIDSFSTLKEEKLDYPKEFRDDVRLYKDEFESILKKFEDIEIRYLMLSDFYDFARLTKRYKVE
jgi:uncharacterized protein (UPF0305 family)